MWILQTVLLRRSNLDWNRACCWADGWSRVDDPPSEAALIRSINHTRFQVGRNILRQIWQFSFCSSLTLTHTPTLEEVASGVCQHFISRIHKNREELTGHRWIERTERKVKMKMNSLTWMYNFFLKINYFRTFNVVQIRLWEVINYL